MASNDVTHPSHDGSSTELTKSVFKNGIFVNPWDTWSSKAPNIFRMLFKEKDHSNVPSKSVSMIGLYSQNGASFGLL